MWPRNRIDFRRSTISFITVIVLLVSLSIADKPLPGAGPVSGGYSSIVQNQNQGQGHGIQGSFQASSVHGKGKELQYSEGQSASGSASNSYPPLTTDWGNQIQGNPNQGKELSSSFNYAPSGGGYSSVSGSGANEIQYGPPAPPAISGGAAHGGGWAGNGNNGPVGTHGDGQSYTYYYQHYPSSYKPQGQAPIQGHGQGHGHGHLHGGSGLFGSASGSWEEGGSLFDFGDAAGGAGLAGIGGLGGLAGVAAIAKGLLALKPLLLVGLLFLIGVPLLLLFLPIPLITLNNIPAADNGDSPAQKVRSLVTSYFSTFSDRILNADECLERIICKIPQFAFGSGQAGQTVQGQGQAVGQMQPTIQFQSKAKFLWEKYGKKYFSKNSRVQRAVGAFFMANDEASGRSRAEKCNQRFKCSNKLF